MRGGFQTLTCVFLLILSMSHGSARAETPALRVGLAKAKVTPEEPIRMAGYAGREEPSDGVLSDLYVKAMAVEYAGARPVLLVTADLINFRAETWQEICRRIGERTGLKPEEILLVPSHTHAGPVFGPEVRTYGLAGEELAVVERYTEKLYAQVADLAAEALETRQPAKLSSGIGKAGFVMNRREQTKQGIRIGVNPEGFVDRSVPVLRVDDGDGQLRALVFGCACHNTTLGGKNFKISSEYAGFAQEALERQFPGVQAMFMIGCAGDANPDPRGTVELAQEHGRSLAKEVAHVAAGPLRPIAGPLRIAFGWADLPLAPMPSPEELREMAKGPSYLVPNAKRMLTMREKSEELPTHYRAPLSVWQFGNDLTLLALPGEVVSGYVPLMQKALGEEGLWIAGYANESFGYLPTRQVLAEGGYETRGLIFDTGFFGSEVEDAVVATARKLCKEAGRQGMP
ncbi:MAG: neutral/alkaline non-lysosomal ceramidase N-terminal domain-containing protein [Planctomycetota bacterium]